MSLYIENCVLSDYMTKNREKYELSQKYLIELNNNIPLSYTIHIILINNILYKSNRDTCMNTIKRLIDNNKTDHLLIVYYGENVKKLCPIVPLIDEIYEPLSKILHIDFDYSQNYDMDIIKNSIKNNGMIDQMDFSFLTTYQKIFIYD